jgi:sugar fermentation stimulation protein A
MTDSKYAASPFCFSHLIFFLQTMIPFQNKLIHGNLIRRYKRFLADIELDNGQIVTAHCTNSGSMKSCLEEGAEVYVSPVHDPARKTRFTWEMILINGQWVGINTSQPNKIVPLFMQQDIIPGLEGYTDIKAEVKYQDSRLDLFAIRHPGQACFVEIKNVTLKDGPLALFPDSVTLRGQKHLQTLMQLKEKGFRAVMVYVIQRMDVEAFAPAAAIDKEYALLFEKARRKGVEMIPVQVSVSPEGIRYERILPLV